MWKEILFTLFTHTDPDSLLQELKMQLPIVWSPDTYKSQFEWQEEFYFYRVLCILNRNWRAFMHFISQLTHIYIGICFLIKFIWRGRKVPFCIHLHPIYVKNVTSYSLKNFFHSLWSSYGVDTFFSFLQTQVSLLSFQFQSLYSPFNSCKVKLQSPEKIQMTNKYINGCSTSPVIREMWIKPTMRYHSTPNKVAIIKMLMRMERNWKTCPLLMGA